MKRKIICLLLSIIFALSMAGCTSSDEVPLIEVDSKENVISYSLVTASLDDVIKTQKLDCSYLQTKDQEVSFDTTGKLVSKVYVKNGDKVKKGDILLELSSDSLQEQIDKLTYQIKRNELQLGYLDTDEALDIQDAWLACKGDAMVDMVKEQVKNIQANYERQRVLINDSLEFDRMELAAKKTELKESIVYASMDGVVYKLKQYLEGSTTREGEVILTIVDKSECLFAVHDNTYKDLFYEGQQIDMRVSYSSASGDYILIPDKMESWGEDLFFSVYSAPDEAEDPEVGLLGTMYVPVDSRKSVLSIPKDVLHVAGEDTYVYTLTEDNFREIRYVKVGLIGDDRVEILEGLEEGEKVVKK